MSSARAALLVADDLNTSIEVLRYIADLGGLEGAALVHSSAVVPRLSHWAVEQIR